MFGPVPPVPTRRSPSPVRRSTTPPRRSPSPARRSPSPAQRPPSPAQRSPSPARRWPTPIRHSPSLAPMTVEEEPPVSSPPPNKDISMPTEPQIDYTFADIPRLADAKSIADALRTVIMTRLLRDRQTRDERVNPVLMENLAIGLPPEENSAKTQEQLIEEISLQRFTQTRDDSPFLCAKSWLSVRFDRRRTALDEKKEYLKLEYQALHDHWRRHCDSLNQQAMTKPVESENVPVSGRTTRRSAANLGDTVRSDLEMEQIIASLGYDEATDPNQLSARNLATIPDMISVTGRVEYVFDDTNHFVENPSEYYAPYTGINDWTEPEKEMFLDKYAAFPKQFGAIAEFLPNKTASQCVDYYYLHKKKLIDFRRVVSQFAPNKRRRRRTGKQKGNGLLSDIRQHDAEVNRDQDDSPSYTGRPTRGRRVIPEARKPSVRRNALQLEVTSTATPTPEPEARPKRRRVAVSSRSVLYQDDLLDDDTDGEPKKKKRGRKPKSAAILVNEFVTPVATPPITDMDLDSRVPTPIQWSSEDKALFLELLAQLGENFKRIAVAMPNKTTAQVAEYFTSNFAELDLGSIAVKAVQTATMVDLPEDISISRAASTLDTTLSSAPSPSALQDTGSAPPDTPLVTDSQLAEPTASTPAPNDAAPALDPNEMWDSMDPGSGMQSSTASGRVSPALTATTPVAVSVAKPAPVMVSLKSPTEIVSEKSASHESGAAGPSGQNTVTDKENDTGPQAPPSDLKYSPPVMSSLTYDPTWGYYGQEGVTSPPNRYPDSGVPARPYSPVGVVTSRPPPMMPGPFAMAYPYYIPPPYPSASYHPYSSYKS
ncbi:hypothetical protein DFH07DRAFT_58083 [Mycena maculata]|uniref:SANT domain-containing protein n=1 Tax=Mycena maculata TaxID=230809 RepID=A0AAD7N1F2_9AGAR|nr:hypothetical protein DFH07DRAFT_58083 [Mycena maculata]